MSDASNISFAQPIFPDEHRCLPKYPALLARGKFFVFDVERFRCILREAGSPDETTIAFAKLVGER